MTSPETTPPPPPTTARWGKYVLAFGVSVGVGLAPFLGKLRVPLFSPILDLVPDSLQNTVIPLSSLFMGIVAAAVQWYGGEKFTRTWLRQQFLRSFLGAVAALILFTVVDIMVVVSVQYASTDRASFLVGFQRPTTCTCSAGSSDAECIKELSFNESNIASCWGDGERRIAELTLIFTYCASLSSFAWMIGLLLLGKPKESTTVAEGSHHAPA